LVLSEVSSNNSSGHSQSSSKKRTANATSSSSSSKRQNVATTGISSSPRRQSSFCSSSSSSSSWDPSNAGPHSAALAAATISSSTTPSSTAASSTVSLGDAIPLSPSKSRNNRADSPSTSKSPPCAPAYHAGGKENAPADAVDLVKKANSKRTQDAAQQVLISLIRDCNYDKASKIWYEVVKSSKGHRVMPYFRVLDVVLQLERKDDGIDHRAFRISVGWYLPHAISHISPIVSSQVRDKIGKVIGGWQNKKIFSTRFVNDLLDRLHNVESSTGTSNPSHSDRTSSRSDRARIDRASTSSRSDGRTSTTHLSARYISYHSHTKASLTSQPNASRHECTLFVSGYPSGTTSTDLMAIMTQALIGFYICAPSLTPIRYCEWHGHYAFVSLVSPSLTFNALSLNGMPVEGRTLKIERSNRYIGAKDPDDMPTYDDLLRRREERLNEEVNLSFLVDASGGSATEAALDEIDYLPPPAPTNVAPTPDGEYLYDYDKLVCTVDESRWYAIVPDEAVRRLIQYVKKASALHHISGAFYFISREVLATPEAARRVLGWIHPTVIETVLTPGFDCRRMTPDMVNRIVTACDEDCDKDEPGIYNEYTVKEVHEWRTLFREFRSSPNSENFPLLLTFSRKFLDEVEHLDPGVVVSLNYWGESVFQTPNIRSAQRADKSNIGSQLVCQTTQLISVPTDFACVGNIPRGDQRMGKVGEAVLAEMSSGGEVRRSHTASSYNNARCGINSFVEYRSFDIVEYFMAFGRPSRDRRCVLASPPETFHPMLVEYTNTNAGLIIDRVRKSTTFDRVEITKEEITVAMVHEFMCSRGGKVGGKVCGPLLATLNARRKEAKRLGLAIPRARNQTREEAVAAHQRFIDNQNAKKGRPNDVAFDDKFKQLVAFKETNGHCCVPDTYPANQKLANWVAYNRTEYRFLQEGETSSMTIERIRKLEAIGFVWNFRHYAWNQQYLNLVAFKKQTSPDPDQQHCNVPQDYPANQTLSTWVYKQRTHYGLLQDDKTSSMTIERIRKLEAIGFVWNFRHYAWNQQYLNLVAFKKQTSPDPDQQHCNVPRDYPANQALGNWANTQRTQYRFLQEGKKSSMTIERIQKLEAIGFAWRRYNM